MKICICDDELSILEQLKNFLTSLNNEFIIQVFDNSVELEKELKQKNIDILFMDIKINDINGIEFIKKNEKYLENTKIVYITGYSEYIEDIFETNPTYFLQKPITLEKIKKVVDKINKLEKNNASIIINIGSGVEKIRCNDILFIESYARVLNIHLVDEKVIETYNKLSDILKKLPYNFIKIQKSYIVNMDKIKNYKPTKIVLNNNVELPIGRKCTKEVKEIIMKYIKDSIKDSVKSFMES